MVSTSSSKLIQDRTKFLCEKTTEWNDLKRLPKIFELIKTHLHTEYNVVPEKERIGKGYVFIGRYVAKEIFQYLKTQIKVNEKYYIEFAEKAFIWGEKNGAQEFQYFSLLLLSELINYYPNQFEKIINIIEKCATHEQWTVRETAIYPIIAGLKKNANQIFISLSNWAKNSDENLRRLVAESLRPKTEIKWIRDPSKNENVLDIITLLRKDTSIYVRKSVGNNIKDLSKYMPDKMLDLMERWIKEDNIEVRDDLTSEEGLTRDQKLLIWTIKHGMRWIREKNPELHPRLERILGKNYILYFDEKKNRKAKPI